MKKYMTVLPFTGVLLVFTFGLFGFCAGCGIDGGLTPLAAHPKIQWYSSISLKNYFVNSNIPLSGRMMLTPGDGAEHYVYRYRYLYLSSYTRNPQSNAADKQHPQEDNICENISFIISGFRRLYPFQTFNLAKEDFSCFFRPITVNTCS